MAIYIVSSGCNFPVMITDDPGHLPVIIPAEVKGGVLLVYFLGGPKMTPTPTPWKRCFRKPKVFLRCQWTSPT